MNHAIVTIIIATYNRPDTLKAAIKSVLNQTLNNWQLFVMGDKCDPRTDILMLEFSDSRIRYFNLPERFGEQSGPNSVGLSLVDTPYVSFLNHDDIWLPDHLEIGVKILEKGPFDFYIGGTAISRYVDYAQAIPELIIDEINVENRSPFDFFFARGNKYEPASSWIIKQNAAKKIGPWKYYTDLYRSPAEDYLLRAWRSKCSFYFSSIVTTWRFLTQYHNDSSRNSYNYKSFEHAKIIELIESNSGEDTRRFLNEKLNKWNLMSTIEKEAIQKAYNIIMPEAKFHHSLFFFRKIILATVMNKITAHLYYLWGIDSRILIIMIRNNKKGSGIKNLISIRTGNIPQKPNLASTISRVKKEQSFLNERNV